MDKYEALKASYEAFVKAKKPVQETDYEWNDSENKNTTMSAEHNQ